MVWRSVAENSATSGLRRTIVFRKISTSTLSVLLGVAGATTAYLGAAAPADAGTEAAKELAKQPGVIFARELADVPGKNMVVVKLEFPPKPPQAPQAPQQYIGHRHPGSTYVYVIKGAVRLGIDGQPVQVVHAGESFFEPVGALHTVAENASTTEPASAIAVLVVPDGAPILTPVEATKK
jgi:quercetin dioxygenase-like cupin family protein